MIATFPFFSRPTHIKSKTNNKHFLNDMKNYFKILRLYYHN